MVVVVFYQKVFEILVMLQPNPLDLLFWSGFFFFCLDHRAGAVCIVCAHVDQIIVGYFLESHPDVCLDVLQHMSQMYRPVGIWQGTSNEDFFCHDDLDKFVAPILAMSGCLIQTKKGYK